MISSIFTLPILSLLLLLVPTNALPTPHHLGITNRLFSDSDSTPTTGATTPFSGAQVNSTLQRPAEFARLAYCPTAFIENSTCGLPCDAIAGSGVKILQAGGDAADIPFYFIAHDPSTDSVVVAHQGTDTAHILSIANDADFGLVDLNTTLFPSPGSTTPKVHAGFQDTFGRTSDAILSGVQSALSSTGATNVLVTGHSLGAALASMDAVMLKQNLGSGVSVQSQVFGLPRGGDQAWADLVDSTLGNSFSFVTNQNDPVPTVPPRFLDFQHPSGEIHIQTVDPTTGDASAIVACPGQDNTACSEGNSLLKVDVQNHLGPYFNNLSFGDAQCLVSE